MASKGQKFNKYTQEFKSMILDEYLSGVSSRFLEEKYNISRYTIQTWGKKYKYPDKYQKLGRRGRPKEKDLTIDDYKERYEILKKYQAFLKAQRERK
jgi:transposase